jgi:hypothetical protein
MSILRDTPRIKTPNSCPKTVGRSTNRARAGWAQAAPHRDTSRIGSAPRDRANPGVTRAGAGLFAC